jgi:signal peptidase I
VEEKEILEQDGAMPGEEQTPEETLPTFENTEIPATGEDEEIEIPSFVLAEDDTTDEIPEAPVSEEQISEETSEEDLDTDQLLAMMADDKPLVKVTRRNKTTWKHGVLLYLHDLVYLLAAVIVIFLLLFRVVVVSGRSMNDTLYDGDYLLLLSNIFYSEPQAGDVIVAAKEDFKNGAPIVKRVIATEGQWVDIDFERGIVYVGDDPDHMVPLVEPYTKTLTTKAEGVVFPLQVDEGHIFVLGDNRDDSKDSRHPEIGLIDKREVMGKVIFLFFPGTNYGMRPRDFNRIGVVA